MRTISDGLFIALEGIDGAGTTTQGDRITAELQSKQKIFFTREPSNGPIGMIIRLALSRRLLGQPHAYHDTKEASSGSPEDLDQRMIALMFASDRADHIATQIDPNLRRGRLVISDRYILSSLAYQGIDLPLDWLLSINSLFRTPDLTFFLDVPTDHSELRMRSSRWSKDLYEEREKLDRVREKYKEIIALNHPLVGPVVTVDGTLKPKKVTDIIVSAIQNRFLSEKPISPRSSLELFN